MKINEIILDEAFIGQASPVGSIPKDDKITTNLKKRRNKLSRKEKEQRKTKGPTHEIRNG